MGGFRLKRGCQNSNFLTTDVKQMTKNIKQHQKHNHNQKICDQRQEKRFKHNLTSNIQIGGT